MVSLSKSVKANQLFSGLDEDEISIVLDASMLWHMCDFGFHHITLYGSGWNRVYHPVWQWLASCTSRCVAVVGIAYTPLYGSGWQRTLAWGHGFLYSTL